MNANKKFGKHGCTRCSGTGADDSGGNYESGEPVMVSCECTVGLLYPSNIRRLVERCEANEKAFDNQDMSEALTYIAILRDMLLTEEQANKQLAEVQSSNHCTIREMAGDLQCLSNWIHLVNCGQEPSFERTNKVGDICNKWRR